VETKLLQLRYYESRSGRQKKCVKVIAPRPVVEVSRKLVICKEQFVFEAGIHYNSVTTCEKVGMSDRTRQIGKENCTKTFVPM
jgi:hypothetical protein